MLVGDAPRGDGKAFWGGYFWAARTPQLSLYSKLKPPFIALARSGSRRREQANKLAGMILAGWGGDGDTDERSALIPDVELREVLIHADDDLRTQMLWYLERWSLEPESSWADRLLPFLRDVWPRQRAVRNPRTSARLVDLALAMGERFPEVAAAVLPLVGPIAGASVRIGPFLDIEAGIASSHPAALLDLLWKVLPADPWAWPYETGKMLVVLADRDETRGDLRLAELLRRNEQRGGS